VVPTAAIMQSQKGTVVYVVKADRTAEARTVATSRTVEDETVIVSGVKPGETIVTDGQSQLVDGSKVQIKNDTGAAEPSASGGAAQRNRPGDQAPAAGSGGGAMPSGAKP